MRGRGCYTLSRSCTGWTDHGLGHALGSLDGLTTRLTYARLSVSETILGGRGGR